MAKPESQSSEEDPRGLGWLLGVIVVALVVGWFVVGPGSDPPADPQRPVTLVLAVPANQEDEAYYRRIIARYEAEHPHVAVELRPITGNNYYQKLLVMLASGLPPDLMWMGMGFAEFANRGAFLDVSERLKRDIDVADYLPQALKWYQVNGQQLGAPYIIDVQFIAYNKKAFDEAKLPYPSDDWDYERFLADARKLTLDRDGDGKTDQYGYYGQLEAALFDAEFISADGKKATCDTPQMIEFLRTNLDLFAKYKVAPTPQQISGAGSDRYTIFRQGRAAMMVMYTWDLPYMRQQCADMDWDITLNPRVRQRAQWASSAAVLVSSQTRHAEESWALARLFLEDDFQLRMAQKGGLPSSRRVARELIERNREKPANLGALVEAADFLYASPRIANFTELQSQFLGACDRVWMGLATPRQAMAQAQRQINWLIQRRQQNEASP